MTADDVDSQWQALLSGWRVALRRPRGCSYNTFVSQEESIKAQWAQVENQLQRRNDLIPNLVETVKGIAQQEQDVFGQIADRARSSQARTTPEQRMQAANEQSCRARAAARRRRELSAPEVERAVRPADGRTGGHREPHRRRAHAL